jgi:hypothetical protein
MPNAHAWLNDVFETGDIISILVNNAGTNIGTLPTGLSPATFNVCNHNSATFARDAITAPEAEASVEQTLIGKLISTDVGPDPGTPSVEYSWIWNLTEFEFAAFVGTPYTLNAVSYSGYSIAPTFTGWGAFGPTTTTPTVNTNDIVVYLVNNLRIGYKNVI